MMRQNTKPRIRIYFHSNGLTSYWKMAHEFSGLTLHDTLLGIFDGVRCFGGPAADRISLLGESQLPPLSEDPSWLKFLDMQK